MHNIFRCGHEFCYSCGAEYRDGQQTCQCAFWDEDNSEDLVTQSMQESEQWAWETFNSLPMVMDAYSDQERSQLALIQRFLAGGFSLSDHHPYQSPPRCTDSYVDAMKDLNQLPWLERFVSVISDSYYEDFIQWNLVYSHTIKMSFLLSSSTLLQWRWRVSHSCYPIFQFTQTCQNSPL